MGCVFAYVIIMTLLGPEKLGQTFDVEHDTDIAEVAARRGAGNEEDTEKGGISRRDVEA